MVEAVNKRRKGGFVHVWDAGELARESDVESPWQTTLAVGGGGGARGGGKRAKKRFFK